MFIRSDRSYSNGCHLPTVHDQVAIRTSRTIILFQLWDLELVGNQEENRVSIHKPIKIGPALSCSSQ